MRVEDLLAKVEQYAEEEKRRNSPMKSRSAVRRRDRQQQDPSHFDKDRNPHERKRRLNTMANNETATRPGRAPYVVTNEMETKVLNFIRKAKGKGRSIEELMDFVKTTRPTAEKFIAALNLGVVNKEGRKRFFGEGGEPFVKGTRSKPGDEDPMAKSGRVRVRPAPLQSGAQRIPAAQSRDEQPESGAGISPSERERMLSLAEVNAAVLRKLAGI